jgi:quercetin dioxygenase-like cupin family protein
MSLKIAGAVAAGALAAGGLAQPPHAPPTTTRHDLQQHDLDIPGHEAVQVRIDFPPGAVAPRHSHPGEEVIYVLKGTLQYRFDGKPPVTLSAGGVLFVPTGTIHMATNVGKTPASELGTYIVEKGKPLVIPAK